MARRIIQPFLSSGAHRLRSLSVGFVVSFCVLTAVLMSCGKEAVPSAAAIQNRDSLPILVTDGVSKLISDSGVIRYKVISEEWKVYDKTQPPRQEFMKGVILERFDEKFKVNLFVTCDTAYCYNNNLWELRGRVFVKNYETKTVFRTEELFWNMGEHRFYSNKYMYIKMPDRELEGNSFFANEQLTKYDIRQSRGFMPKPKESTTTPGAAPTDSAAARQAGRQPVAPAMPVTSARSAPPKPVAAPVKASVAPSKPVAAPAKVSVAPSLGARLAGRSQGVRK